MNQPLLALIAGAAFFSTLFGGLLALKLRDKLHLILGFSAGAVIGVAFFDLLPEAIVFGEKFHSPAVILSFTALGFLSYLVLDRIQLFHGDAQQVTRWMCCSSPQPSVQRWWVLGRRTREFL